MVKVQEYIHDEKLGRKNGKKKYVLNPGHMEYGPMGQVVRMGSHFLGGLCW